MESHAHIGPSIHIKGNITSREPLTIAGHVEGTVDASGHRLTVMPAARLSADIVAHTIVVAGTITGSVTADARIIVEPTGTIEGELSAPSVSVGDGALLQGRCEIAGKRAELQWAS